MRSQASPPQRQGYGAGTPALVGAPLPHSVSSMDIASLGALTLPDAAGEPHELGGLWADRTIVLVFLRHFG